MSTTTTAARRVRLGSLALSVAAFILTALFLSYGLRSSSGTANTEPSPTSQLGASSTLGSATPTPVATTIATTIATCPPGFICTPDSPSAGTFGLPADAVNQISLISGFVSLVGFVASGGRFLLGLVRPMGRKR